MGGYARPDMFIVTNNYTPEQRFCQELSAKKRLRLAVFKKLWNLSLMLFLKNSNCNCVGVSGACLKLFNCHVKL